MRRAVMALVATLALAAVPDAQTTARAAEAFERGVDAYRRGAHAEADTLWRACLEEELTDAERARVAYDLGNAAWRRERVLEAVGWYSVSLRLEPRAADVWHNLELARAAAGLDPADRGDLRSTVKRLLVSLRPHERRLLVLFALVPLALALAAEAFLGGRLWRRLGQGAALLVLLAALPWVHGRMTGDGDPLLVVRAPSVALRSEPRRALAPIGELRAGDEVERVDALPGWVRVEQPDGTRGWVQEEAVFPLGRP